MQQYLRSLSGYILGIVGLVIALFIPFSYIILRVFQPLVAALLLGAFVPLIALVLGIIGFIKSSKNSVSISKTSKVLNIITIIISIILIILSVYIFIKSRGVISV